MTELSRPLPDPVIARYLDWCTNDRAESPHTVRRRRAVLRQLPDPVNASRDDVEAWWHQRVDQAAGTRINSLATLRHFYRWCQRWELRVDDPTARLMPPRKPKGKPTPMRSNELDLVRSHLDTMPDDGPKLHRAIALAVGAGLRRAEIAALDWSQIEPTFGTATIIGKGNKTRVVRFTPKLLAVLGEPQTSGNVVTASDEVWSADKLGKKVNSAIHAAGVTSTLHKLRHRYGFYTYQATLNPKAVADQMGHASVATTMDFYVANTDDAAKAVALAADDAW